MGGVADRCAMKDDFSDRIDGNAKVAMCIVVAMDKVMNE